MICPKCGTKNDEDAKYCEGCGRSLQTGIGRHDTASKGKNESEGMHTNVKVLIVICVVLIAVLGVAAGMLLQKPSQVVVTQANSTPSQQTSTQPYQPTWHKVAVYTGPGEDYGSFTIKGNQFKVTMSAVPAITYNVNYLNVYVYSGSTIGVNQVGYGTLSWTDTESPNKKEDSILVPYGNGVYTLDILPTDIENYAVTVWDYY